MSAFFLAINRDNTDFDSVLAERMMVQIDRFGHGTRNLLVDDDFAIGYQGQSAFSKTPDEPQPYVLGDHLYLLFQGRIDNRKQLMATLKLDHSVRLSDADLVARYYRQFGDQGIDHLRGPFVMVFFNKSNNDVVAYRDAMGGRYLVYRVTEKHILIATYEMALVAHNSFGYCLNKEKSARLLTNQMEPHPSSFIEGLVPLNPGMKMTVSTHGVELKRYYSFNPSTRIKYARDDDYAQEYKRLLNQAVTRRLDGVAKPGIMLSGGLDSVPVAILGAQESKALIAFSWVFERYPDLDERQYSTPVCQQLAIEQVMINCDELWPQFDASMDLNPIIPFGIPFSEFQEHTFRQAKSKGVTVMLTGIHGDLLYEYTNGVLYELLKAGDLKRFVREFRVLWKAVSSPLLFIKHYFLRPLGLVQKISAKKRQSKVPTSDILIDELAERMMDRPHWLLSESQYALRPQQWRVVLDGFAGDDAVHGRYLEAKYGIERRYPFRDRDLCEFMLSIPSHQLYFALQKRPIVKRAFANEFSPELMSRNTKTVFSDVIYKGVEQDQRSRQWFDSGTEYWTEFVKHCYFDAKTERNHSLEVVRWRCGYYDYWKSVCYNPFVQDSGLNK